ncbi:type II toxin-antitoxin system RelE/ParE family toxin [Aureispira sp. CCB-E]|uniref:type II toxin-antitoxin system RelE/ParE family toxin n=1 Tax=Aureispira sp. CCB-E TaxID=3051121 RepID=UPI00286895E5|nr:type II toxin-antitoxin system RelE/ParE family toxin [Aureispira sp. CCB-E]WMX16227.1 type II toxin-antitoxin system RelE/ParE family toxin [Aureispira sp. CCB-E]WMX16235.1 type II toxin-antitoxin system RelE/ParE family toxin [Aureispira sp. CCB-E]
MAKVTVKYSTRALNDLEEIEEYYNQYPSSKQMGQIFQQVEGLKVQPLRGRPIPELKDDKNIRHVNAGNYRVIYHVIAEYLLMILRVFHVRRQLNPNDDLDFNN